MISTYLPGASIIALLFIIIVMAIVLLKIRDVQRKKAIWQIQQSQQQSRRALLLYVMLNHQCSEEVAYQRIATHIKKHVPLDDQSYIDRMLAQDRQSLLDQARDLFFHNSNEIDKI